ncbi:hypothetical protein [Alteromonas flava]|uniref:hypothetical protein n=1 Tax=Alteromonas flava TaxID=2048003 RepID=UPI000C28F6F3|nr:hypothetical protein [Alteromonas flava]
MSTLLVITLFVAVCSFSLWLCWLDKVNHWRIVDWLNGRVNNPFIATNNTVQSTASSHSKDELAALRERIEVLERIVTEPSYELNRKINEL